MTTCRALAAPRATSQRPAVVQERGCRVTLSSSFYRPQSCFSRDLAVLSAVVHHRQQQLQEQQHEPASPPPPLHVLDLMSGSGIRGVRYLLQAGAHHVVCNEPDPANTACIEANLAAAMEQVAAAVPGGGGSGGASVGSNPTAGGGRQWRVQARGDAVAGQGAPLPTCELTREDATSLLARCRLEQRFFDLIDADSFGAAVGVVGAALGAVRWGGLLCLTSTAGTLTGGRDPASALALLGQHLAPVPFANEQGLRSLIGLAHREALARRLTVTPLWSLYSPHGPVFRTMLHVTRDQRGPRSPAAASSADYGYVLHWPGSGESSSCGFHEMPGALLRAGSHVGSSSDSSSGSGISSRGSDSDGSPGEPLLSGPLWLGPLHSASHLTALRDEAASRGWLQPEPATPGAAAPARTRKGEICSLHQLLELLLQEAEAEELAAARGQRLPPWFVRANDVGRAGALVGPPARAKLQAELQRRGFVAAPSHVDFGGIKTMASMADCVAAAVEGLGIASRREERAAA